MQDMQSSSVDLQLCCPMKAQIQGVEDLLPCHQSHRGACKLGALHIEV